MPRVHLNIGSNSGDRHNNLNRALDALLSELGSAVYGLRLSPVVESEPWGYESENKFLNVGISFHTTIAPAQLLAITKRAELLSGGPDDSHRKTDGTYADRRVDIDIIHYGTAIYDSPELTIPHPRLHLRRFVIEPLISIDPLWRHPRLGLLPSQLMELL